MIIVKKIRIPELPSENPRRLYISLPRGYRNCEKRYPVLYMFDGHNVFYDSHATFGKSWGMKDYLSRSKRELIVVAVECNHDGMRRLNEYAPWDFTSIRYGSFRGEGKATMDWIVNTLKPEIDRDYRTLPDREHTMIAGSSMGGLMSLYAVTAYNAHFSRAAALSPSMWTNKRKLRAHLKAAKLKNPTRVYIDYGGGEAKKQRLGMAETMFDTAKLLTEAGADVEARLVPGAMHCEADWEKRIPVFMDYLWDE